MARPARSARRRLRLSTRGHARARIPDQVPVTTIVADRNVRRALIHVVVDSHHDLVVIGSCSRGAGRFARPGGRGLPHPAAQPCRGSRRSRHSAEASNRTHNHASPLAFASLARLSLHGRDCLATVTGTQKEQQMSVHMHAQVTAEHVTERRRTLTGL